MMYGGTAITDGRGGGGINVKAGAARRKERHVFQCCLSSFVGAHQLELSSSHA